MAHHHILVEALGLLKSSKSIDDEITELMKKRISRLEAAEEEGKSNRALPKASPKRSSATLVGRALSLVENIKENEDKLGALLGGYLHVRRGCYPSTEHENGTSVDVDGGSASSQSVTVPPILSTGGPSPSLQEIVDAARPGDVVVLRPGVYVDQPLRITVPFLTIRGGGGGPPLHPPKEGKKGTAKGREQHSSSVNSDPKDDFYHQLRVKGLGRATRRSCAGTSSSSSLSRVATDGNQKNVVEDEDDDEDVVLIPKHKTVLHNTTTKAAINICAVGVRIENITIYQSGREAPAVVFNIASPSLSTPLSPLSIASSPNRSNIFVEQGKTAHQQQQQSFSYRDPLSKMSAEHTTSKQSLSQQSGCRTKYNTSVATTANHADNNTTNGGGGCGSTAKDDLLYESLRATCVLATPPLKLPLPFTIIDESTVELITPIYNENEENINNINTKSNSTCKEARLLQIVEDRSVLMLRDCDIVSVSCHAVHSINTFTRTYAYTCMRDGQGGEGVGVGGVGTRETRRGETATRWINTTDQQTERDQMTSLRGGEQHEEEGMLQLVDCRITSYGGVGIQIGLAGAGKKGRAPPAKMRDLNTSSSSRTRTLVLNTTDGVVESPFSLVSPSSSSSSPFTLRTSSQSPTVEGVGYGPQVPGVLISNAVFGYCGLSAIVLSDTAGCSYFHVSRCDMRGGCGQHGIHFTAAVACGSNTSNKKNIIRAHVPLTSKGEGVSTESIDKDKKTLSDGTTSGSGCNDAVSGSGVHANTVTERRPTRCARAVTIVIEDTIIRSPTLCGILIDEGRVVSCVLRTTAVLTEERSVGIYVHPNASLLTASNNVL